MTPIGYLGFALASGETLLLPQGAAFELVRRVDDLAPPSRPRLPTAVVRRASAVMRSGGKAVGDELARHRAAVEAKGLTVAAEELGVTYNTLYYQAKRGKWKLPKSAPRAVRATTVPTPKRRCDAEGCGKVTNSDPCAHCGAPWLRSK
jgi:hypothetical protein